MAISAVVATRNRPGDVLRTVASILDNTAAEPFEVIVVDQSDDRQTEMALRAFDGHRRLRYVRSNSAGISRARNEAAALAAGRVLAFADEGCTVPRDWLARVSKELARHPLLGAVLSRIEAGPEEEPARSNAGRPAGKRRCVRNLMGYSRGFAMTTGMAVRREAFESVGGFDPVIGAGSAIPAGEGYDLAVRLLAGGWMVVEAPHLLTFTHGLRANQERGELARDKWTGIGAIHAKLLRSGHVGITAAIAFNLVFRCLLGPAVGLLNPRGAGVVRRQLHYWDGFRRAFAHPIDRLTSQFVPQTPAASSSDR